jgi:anti-sigma B factor antagonist
VESESATSLGALPPPTKVEVHSDDSGPVRALLAGQIDRATVPQIREQLAEVQRRCGVKDMVMDLSGVDFIDSSGLHILLQVHQELEHAAATLVLLAPSEPVRFVLSLTGLDRHLTVVDTLPQVTALLARNAAGESGLPAR